MEKEYVLSVANTLFSQLFWSITKNVFFSWGVSKKIATVYEEMPTLAMKVSGAIHKGWVYASYNEGNDQYEIRLLNDKLEVIGEKHDCFCDNVGELIDSLIERPGDMSTDDYYKMAMADSFKKFAEKA